MTTKTPPRPTAAPVKHSPGLALIEPAPGTLPTFKATVQDVAVMLAVSVATVRREAKAGRLPHVLVGRQYRFNLGSVAAWAQDKEFTSID